MKKVAIIITRLTEGGASEIVRQLVIAGYSKYDFTLFAGTEGLSNELLKEFEQYLCVILLPQLVRNISPLKDLSAYFYLLKEFKSNKFDVVHTHTSKAGFIGRLAAAKAGIKNIIHTPHGTIYTPDNNIDGVPRGFGKRLIMYAEQYTGKKTTSLTTLSKHEKDICVNLSLSKKENTHVISNGIDAERFNFTKKEKEKARKKLQIKENEILLLSIGRMTSEKGHAVLVDVFRKTLDSNKQIKLIIVGEGAEKDRLEKENSDLIEKNLLIFTGLDKNIEKYLAAADIFILPSLYEGFGIAAVEAMATGLPVIVSNVGGLPEIVRDKIDGFFAEPGDSTDFSEKILQLLNSKEKRVKMGNNARVRAKEYTLEKMYENYFNLY
ncbi:MAG: glycosyltransferase family 4 protein [Verrucomicrobiota bacterium]|nr:glycosyltransferase family 4 protein [Verrucomicrobiota bacterium]